MDKAKFEDYEGFTEKFKPKKTTDDCYTPPAVMEVVNDYVSKRWGLLLSERAAAERAAAERAAAERAAAEHYELSDREKEIQKGLGKHEN